MPAPMRLRDLIRQIRSARTGTLKQVSLCKAVHRTLRRELYARSLDFYFGFLNSRTSPYFQRRRSDQWCKRNARTFGRRSARRTIRGVVEMSLNSFTSTCLVIPHTSDSWNAWSSSPRRASQTKESVISKCYFSVWLLSASITSHRTCFVSLCNIPCKISWQDTWASCCCWMRTARFISW